MELLIQNSLVFVSSLSSNVAHIKYQVKSRYGKARLGYVEFIADARTIVNTEQPTYILTASKSLPAAAKQESSCKRCRRTADQLGSAVSHGLLHSSALEEFIGTR